MKNLLFGLFLIVCAHHTVSAQAVTQVWIGNQGNFSDGNGSLMVHDLSTMETTIALENFGSIVQSMTLHEDRLYVASNTSGAIDIVDANTRMRVGQIANVDSPRYIAVGPDGKAYVSNLYTSSVTVLDLARASIIGEIAVGSNPEDIAIVGDRAYVANSGFGADTTVTVIDVATDTVIETIDVECDGPRHLEVDAEEEVWVFCTGNTVYNDDFSEVVSTTNAGVTILDGATGMQVAKIPLVTQAGAAALGQDSFMSVEANQAVLLQGPAIGSDSKETQVIVFNTTLHEITTSFTLAGDTPVGAIAYDAETMQYYAARFAPPPNSFTSAGSVTVHSKFGGLLDTIEAGIGPAHLILEARDEAVSSTLMREKQSRALHTGFPNPFQTDVAIPLSIEFTEHVRLTVYDMLGREVAVLVDRELVSGEHTVPWHAPQLGSGLYRVSLDSNGQKESRILVKAR